MVCRDKNAVRNMVGLDDVMGQPLAANMVKSVEMGASSSSGSSSGGSMEGTPEPARKRGLHERKLSETTDIILDLEYGKSSRRTSNLRPIGAQVWPPSLHCSMAHTLDAWQPARRRAHWQGTFHASPRNSPFHAAREILFYIQLLCSRAFECFHVLHGASIAGARCLCAFCCVHSMHARQQYARHAKL